MAGFVLWSAFSRKRRSRQKPKSVVERLKAAVLAVRRIAQDSEALERHADTLFWLCLLLSLTPLMFSVEGLLGSFAIWKLPWTDGTVAPDWLGLAKSDVFSILAVVMVLCAAVSGEKWYFVAAVTPMAAVLLAKVEPVPVLSNFGTVAYLAASAYGLALFGRHGRFLSPAVAVFAVFALFDTVALTIWALVEWFWINAFGQGSLTSEPYGTLLVGRVLEDYAANLVDILAFFFLLVVLRFLTHLIKDNRAMAIELWGDRENLNYGARKALAMWWPLPVAFAILVLWAYPKFNSFVEEWTMTGVKNQLLCRGVVIEPDDPPCAPFAPAEMTPTKFEPMMRVMVDFSATEYERSASQAINDIGNLTLATTADLKDRLYPILSEKVLPPRMPGTQTRGCGKMNIPCLAGNGVKSLANSGYRRLRDPPLRATERAITGAYVAAGNNVEAAKQRAIVEVGRQVADYRRRANLAIDKTIEGIWFLSVMSLLYSFMVLIKTYGIAFARVIFDYRERYGYKAQLVDSSEKAAKKGRDQRIKRSSIKLHKSSPLPLDGDDEFDYFIHRDRQVASGLGYCAIPFPFKAILRRLRAKNYAMQFYDLTDDPNHDACSIQYDPMERVVVLRIKEGERFVFDFPEVIAFSRGLKIRTFVTLSLHGLVFGKALYRVAEGEGVLVLCLRGQPTVLGGDYFDPVESKRDPYSVVAWNLNTPFKIQSRLSVAGLLFSGYNIAKQSGGSVVIHNNPIRGGAAKMGIARFVRTFLSPV